MRSDMVKTAINHEKISKDGPFVLSLKWNYMVYIPTMVDASFMLLPMQ